MFNFDKNLSLVFVLMVAVNIAGFSAIEAKDESTLAKASSGLKMREVVPAKLGGRIADIAVHPTNSSVWYVAVGSGGVWKTTNAGITFTPLFDNQKSYSIGTVAIDPNNPDVIWVGTGENVSGRHVAWGDGVYKSLDGGKSWKNMGLPNSQHISKFLIDPKDSNIVYVASEGPLWSAGGDRGVYKTVDGGESWKHVLKVDKNTGVTDLEFAPGSNTMIYAAAYQRRRSTWALHAGGPSSGFYKSTDSGATWDKKSTGLPTGDVGKIGLAVTKADPNIVYATIEADKRERGFYKSTDKGESFEKLNSYVSGGTGPHYYQELEASQKDAKLVYQMDVFLHRSRDSGKSFDIVGTGREKHSDNHAMWIDPNNDDHFLVGSDAGLYETFDQGVTYRHFNNLPISQFYKVAVDNALPFYNILGGAQDLGTVYGPSRTMNTEGVRNQDWYIPLGADGYGVDFHPNDNNTMYMMWQGGSLMRVDKTTEEGIYLTPTANQGDAPERWNWDSPLLISPHKPDRIYYGSQRVWASDDRGNSWNAISPDLTRNQNRYELKMTDNRVWSVDALYDTYAMSQYNTTTALSESPVKEGIIYAGTDDGIIQSTNDGGANWSQSRKLGNIPSSAFINDVEASLFASDTVFAVASNHKVGDFSPYVVESNNHGKSWKSIAGDLPKGVIIWAIEQDHINKDMLILGAENGLYFSLNRGKNWQKMAGTPTIAFRDVKIQRRDNDIIGATFGRGFYIMDDYTPLRTMASGVLKQPAALFPVRDAWWYVPNEPGQAKGEPTLGSAEYNSDNPDFGATFTYYLKDGFASQEENRHKAEKVLRKKKKDIAFPGYDRLRDERREVAPSVMLLVRDSDGTAVRWVKGSAKAGVHRIAWDLRFPAPDPISLTKPAFQPPWAGDPIGPLAAPGTYTAELMLVENGEVTSLAKPEAFKVKPVPGIKAIDFEAVAAFQKSTSDLMKGISSVNVEIGKANDKLAHMREALLMAPQADKGLFKRLSNIAVELDVLSLKLNGNTDRNNQNEPTVPSISGRAGYVAFTHWSTTQEPTQTMRDNLRIATKEYQKLVGALDKLLKDDLPALDAALTKAGAPSSR
jgi:photosystem II stability/assembly factor-like uncharacterized protein